MTRLFERRTERKIMKLYDQKVLTDIAKDKHGDCFRACIRTLFQRDLPSCPHPIGVDGENWSTALWDYLEDDELDLVYYPFRPDKDYSFLHLPEKRVVIASGASVRTAYTGARHAVIWDILSQTMIHDPHPGRDGLISIDGFWTKGEEANAAS